MGAQHLPPKRAHGISPCATGIAPRQTRAALSMRPVIGHAHAVCGTRVSSMAHSANNENGRRRQKFIALDVEKVSIPLLNCIALGNTLAKHPLQSIESCSERGDHRKRKLLYVYELQ